MAWIKFSEKAPIVGQLVIVFKPKLEAFGVYTFCEKRSNNKIKQYWDHTHWNSSYCEPDEYWHDIEPVTVNVTGTYPKLKVEED